MVLDAISETRLALIYPGLADKIHRMADIVAPFRVTQGLRTWQEQAVLYAQGRTAPGTKVTDAAPGHSWHGFGLAVDLVPMDQEPPQPDWTISHPVWQRLISAGTSLGLVAGAQFRTFPDWPHFQYTAGVFPVSPDDEMRYILMDKGIAAVWQELEKRIAQNAGVPSA